MKERPIHVDNIDLELSRTYFRKGSDMHGPSREKEEPPRRNNKKDRRITVLILFLSFLLISTWIYLLSGQRFVLDINISVDRPEESEVLPPLQDRTSPPPNDPLSSETHEAAGKTTKPDPVSLPGTAPCKKILFDFEEDLQGWEIPAWETEKDDHVATGITRNLDRSVSGKSSLELTTNFPGEKWTAALAEIQQFIDLDGYGAISADIFLPEEAPAGLRGKLILTAGEDWDFIEMTRGVRLVPGIWTRVSASLSENSRDWRIKDLSEELKRDIRKISVRIESDKRPAYSGPVYIDNISIEPDKDLR